MNPNLRSFLANLHTDGAAHDATQADRLQRRRNLDPDTAQFVSMLVRLMNAQRVIEVGTSNGYSTIWLAGAVRDTAGLVTTLDIAPQTEAQENTTSAGVHDVIEFVQRDAGEYLASLPNSSVDVLFLDGERTEYAGWWPHPYRVLRPGGLMLIDNAHRPAPRELIDFMALIDDQSDLESLTLSVGSGLTMVRKS